MLVRIQTEPLSHDPGRALALCGAFLTAVLYLYPLVLGLPLLDPDEGLHAAIAQEMVESGRYAVPRFLGQPFLDKPILFFWMLASSLRAFGMTEFAVRLPGLLCGWLGAFTTGLLGWQLLGRRVGTLAGLIHATLILPMALNQAPVHDVALVPWTNLALLGFWRLQQETRIAAGLREATLVGIWVGLAGLTKGLVGAALLGVTAVPFLLLKRRLSVIVVAGLALSFIVAAVVAAPWFVAMERVQPGYAYYYFVERHVLGFATSTQRHGGAPWWYYLPILGGGGLPWVAYLLPSARQWWFARQDRSEGQAGAALDFVWLWLVTSVAVFSLSSSKLVTYVLPVFPAMAILIAVPWARLLDRPPQRLDRLFTIGVQVQRGFVAALVPIGLVAGSWRFGAHYGWWVWILGLLMVTMSWMALAPRRFTSPVRVLIVSMVLLAVGFALIMTVVLPPIAASLSARELAHYLNRRGRFPTRVLVVDERIGSLVFYLDPPLRRGLTPERIRNVGVDVLLTVGKGSSGAEDTLIAIPERHVARVSRLFDLANVPTGRVGHYQLCWARDLRPRAVAPAETRSALDVPGVPPET